MTEPQQLLSRAAECLRMGDCVTAVRLARSAGRAIRDPFLRALNVGGVLIDAGSYLRRSHLIHEGIRLLADVERLVPQPQRAAYLYNLGNGHAEAAKYERGTGPGTRSSRDLAISCLDESLRLREFADARTNLASALMAQWRLVEALDEFELVLAAHPEHHQAMAHRGYALTVIHGWAIDHKGLLVAALRDHENAIAHASAEPVFQGSYERVAAHLRGRVKPYVALPNPPTPYEKWIWANRLALNPCPLCESETPSAFDLYPLAGRLESKRRVPPARYVLDMINKLCQSYATARWLLYSGLACPPPEKEHQVFVPASTGAEFGLRTGLVMAACSSFYSVLNQISFAANGYFRLGLKPRLVSLATIWAKDPKARTVPVARTAIRRRMLVPPNPGLTALYGLARSLDFAGGRYHTLRDLRNKIEHHLVVASERPSSNPYYTGLPPEVIADSALKLGRVARAAIWYFSAAVLHAERRRARRAIHEGYPVVRSASPKVERA